MSFFKPKKHQATENSPLELTIDFTLQTGSIYGNGKKISAHLEKVTLQSMTDDAIGAVKDEVEKIARALFEKVEEDIDGSQFLSDGELAKAKEQEAAQ